MNDNLSLDLRKMDFMYQLLSLDVLDTEIFLEIFVYTCPSVIIIFKFSRVQEDQIIR